MCSSHRSARDGIAVFEVDLVADMEWISWYYVLYYYVFYELLQDENLAVKFCSRQFSFRRDEFQFKCTQPTRTQKLKTKMQDPEDSVHRQPPITHHHAYIIHHASRNPIEIESKHKLTEKCCSSFSSGASSP